MVEAVANSVEDRLIDGLSFKLNPGASYVVDRRSVTFHPQGSNIYKPNSGTKVIRFNLTGDSWMDPSTFRFSFVLKNDANYTAARALRPIGPPWGFFRRLRILAGGQIIEDIDNYNRVHELMHLLSAKGSRDNDGAEALGYSLANTPYQFPATTAAFPGIAQGEQQTVLMPLLSGLLSQRKFLPIRYMPLAIEIELADDNNGAILSGVPTGVTTQITVTGTTPNTSTEWSIINPEIKVDLCTLDNALDNSYAEHLLSGKSLPINYSTYISQMSSITQPKSAVNVARALTRLKSLIVTFDKADADATTRPFLKSWNNFFSPMSKENKAGNYKHVQDGEFEYHVQIGSKLYPEYPIRSHAEAFYQLRKMMGILSSSVHNFDINNMSYRDCKCILATDTEKVLEAGGTGLNTRAGDLMRIKFELPTTAADRIPERMHIVMHSDQILEIRGTGVQVFD